jgi:hypothetical protein
MGTGTLINVANGTDFSYDPVVLDSFRNAATHTAPGNLQPSLEQALPQTSAGLLSGLPVNSTWGTGDSIGVIAVSAIMMRTLQS